MEIYTVQITPLAREHPEGQEFSRKCDYVREAWSNARGLPDRPHGAAVTIREKETGKIVEEVWYRNGALHRDDGPAIVRALPVGDRDEYWYRDGLLHRDDGPARLLADEAGREIFIEWYRGGKLHAEGRPALIHQDGRGLVHHESWSVDGKFHRIGGPAFTERDESTGVNVQEEWYQDGVQHREDGPAVLQRDRATGALICEGYFRRGVEISAPASKADCPSPEPS